MNAKKHVERLGQMRSTRGTTESHWQECLDYAVPRKADITRTHYPGDKRNLHLFDSTAEQANEMLASALYSMLTNLTVIFFELTTGDKFLDDEDDVRVWLKESAETMFHVLNNSNFQTEIHEIYVDLCSIGTACLSMEEDDDLHIRFASRHMGGIYVAENNLGVIDTVYRSFKWKVRQAVQEWGKIEPLEKYMSSQEQDIEILHAVYPRIERDSRMKNPGNMKFASDYILVDSSTLLTSSGYRSFPYAVPRWTKSTGEIYGRSPTMKALPDIKMINEMMKTTISAAQKVMDPPLMVPDDGFILPVDTTPAGLNYYRAGSQDRIQPFGNDARIDFGYQVMDDVRKRIRDAYHINQLQLAQGPQMTATEVNQRTEESMRLIGPVLGRQQPELLRPMIDRLFEILFRKGIIKEPPDVLRGTKVDVQYTSTIAKAQRSTEVQNLLRAFQVASPFIQADPQAMQVYDADEIARWTAGMYGAPTRVIRDKRAIAKMRAEIAKVQQMQMQQEQELRATEGAKNLAPVAAAVKQEMTNGGQGT